MRNGNPTRRNGLLLVVLLIAQLLLMSGHAGRSDGSTVLERGVVRFTAPVIRLGRLAGSGLEAFSRGVRDIRQARRENARLREEVQQLRSELNDFREQALENGRLRQLLVMREHMAPRSIAGRVIAARFTERERMIEIDLGTDDGIRPDMAVVAWGGAVGRVISAKPRSASVRLLTDPNSGAAGIVQRSRVEGIVVGRGRAPLEMVYVAGFADVVLGDRVVTSGLDGVFPKGLGLGRIAYLDESSAVEKKILLEAEVDFSRLEEVLVLLGPGESATLSARRSEDGR